jgi:hypothetical protein
MASKKIGKKDPEYRPGKLNAMLYPDSNTHAKHIENNYKNQFK